MHVSGDLTAELAEDPDACDGDYDVVREPLGDIVRYTYRVEGAEYARILYGELLEVRDGALLVATDG